MDCTLCEGYGTLDRWTHEDEEIVEDYPRCSGTGIEPYPEYEGDE